jgi:DNA invertase Pin-like site-specific DNA recombinase
MSRQEIDAQHRRDLRAHRIKRRLFELGARRKELRANLASTDSKIAALLEEATDAGVPMTEVGELTGISRVTLYRWQNSGR